MSEVVFIRTSIPLESFDIPGVRARVEKYTMDSLRDETGIPAPIFVRWEFFPIREVAVCEASIGGRRDA